MNLIAETAGVAVLDTAALHAVNRVHPMITIATVPPFQQMRAGGMVATIKVISYAVPGAEVARAAAAGAKALRVAPPVHASAGLVITQIEGGPTSDKGARAIADRLAALGMDLAETVTVPHRAAPLAEALPRLRGDIALILTGSATSDIDDVAPSAVRRAGGSVERFGMPVDPGNLLFLGRLGARPVIGLPGCARSPALNGADWVLSRVVCGIEVTGADIAAMGVGGLLKEIPTRPQPRAGRAAPEKGRARRPGANHRDSDPLTRLVFSQLGTRLRERGERHRMNVLNRIAAVVVILAICTGAARADDGDSVSVAVPGHTAALRIRALRDAPR